MAVTYMYSLCYRRRVRVAFVLVRGYSLSNGLIGLMAKPCAETSACEKGSVVTRAGWYVAQVETGKEQKMCLALLRECEDVEIAEGVPLLEECFSPTYVHRLKYSGEWRDVEEPLLPGYVVAVTTDPVALSHKLYTVRDFSRLLKLGTEFIPLREDERAWIDKNTESGDRSIPISIGYREGDTLVITEGPLKGCEAMIQRIIRKKCVAILEIHAGNLKIKTEVGLALLPKKDAERSNKSSDE